MIWCCCKKDSVLWYFGHCLKIWRAAECSFVSDVAVSGKFVYKSHNRTLSNCSSYSSSNLLKLNTTTMYIISKFDCLILYITSCEWFISISEILPQEDSDSEKKSSMSYHIDEDFKSNGSSTFETISSFTVAPSLPDSTVKANVKLQDVKMSNDPNMTR